MTLYQARHFIRYKLFSRHRKGFGVHPPFAFRFITRVIHGEADRVHDITCLREEFRRSRECFPVRDYGAGAKRNPVRSVRSMALRSSIPERYGLLLTRLARESGGRKMLELGTHLGISSLYLSAGNPDAQLHTVEGDPLLAHRARLLFEQRGKRSIEVLQGRFQEQLELLREQSEQYDLVFLDGNHTYRGTINTYQKLKPLMHPGTLLVIDDIRYSRDMGRAWKEILADPDRTLAVDLFRMGVVFYRKELSPGYYLTRY